MVTLKSDSSLFFHAGQIRIGTANLLHMSSDQEELNDKEQVMSRNDRHEEHSTSHWNIFGNTVEHTITEDDGTVYSGWGWSADEASEAAHTAHDRGR